jgi:hypothetical protein
MTARNLGGRPRIWNSPLASLKVPVEDAELLKAIAFALHLDRTLEPKLRAAIRKE